MSTSKEIRNKINSINNTKKITKAMEIVSISKMRKSQDRMYATRPYSNKIKDIIANISSTAAEYSHPFLIKKNVSVKKIGFIIITTNKGLCGSINTNVLRLTINKIQELEAQGNKIEIITIGNKGWNFLNRINANIIANIIQTGDTPHLEDIIGSIKILLDSYKNGKLDLIYIIYTKFISTMKQKAIVEQLLPLITYNKKIKFNKTTYAWDYIYEPNVQSIIDELLIRYVEAIIYKAIVENTASEQSARMVAMNAANNSASEIMNDLKLIYNKTRQAIITKELSEIVAGASAV